jgi:hypothetical protein
MKFSDDRLRAALRSEAATHHHDRDAMLDRITTASMRDTGPGRRRAGLGSRGPRFRMAAVVAAVVTVFGGGGVGTWALAGGDDQDEAKPAPTPAPVTTAPSPVNTDPVSLTPTTPATTASTAPTPSRTTPSAGPTTVKPSPSLTKGRPGNTRVSQGPLWSDGSIDPDSGDTQGASIVTLKTTAELTSLDVVIRVARTDGLAARGGTKQTPGASVTATVVEEPGAYLYRFTLSPADTLDPGTYTFTAKYTYPPGGRDAGGDTYRATAGAGATALDVYGDFFPTS